MSALDPRSEALLRELAPQVLGAVVRRFRDFAAAEDAVQEALIAAAAHHRLALALPPVSAARIPQYSVRR